MKVILSLAFLALLSVAYSAQVYNVDCPVPNGVNVTNVPNPRDCKTYYNCDTGIPTLMPCPAGLHYNAKEMVCDWPATACCDLRYDPQHKCPNNPW